MISSAQAVGARADIVSRQARRLIEESTGSPSRTGARIFFGWNASNVDWGGGPTVQAADRWRSAARGVR